MHDVIKKKKNIKIVSNDIDLHSAIANIEYFDVTIDDKIGEMGVIGLVDVLIISDKVISVNELDAYESTFKYIDKVFYLCSEPERFSNIKTLLIAKDIIPIPPLLSNNQIVQKVLEYIGEDFSMLDNVFVFIGADNGVGTTMISQSVAEYLAEHLNKKIGLLFLNNSLGLDYIKVKQTVVCLDNIRSKFMNNILSKDELYSSCIRKDNKDNLYILPGAMSIADVKYYHPEDIDNLIRLASKAFDIVIIDAGSNPHYDIQMGIAALNSTNNRFLVVTQSDKVRRNFERIYNQIFTALDFNINDFLLIINKYVDSDELYTDIELANIYKTYRAATVPYLDVGLLAERKQATLLNFRDHYYTSSINQISKIITSKLNISLEDPAIENKSIWFKIKSLLNLPQYGSKGDVFYDR